jgi:hypothetical protein
MPPRRRAPTVTSWTRELQNAGSDGGDTGSGGGPKSSELAGILRKADARLEEMWGYLREVDATSAENLKGFETFLEVVYRLTKSGVLTGSSASAAVVDAVNETLAQIDATKKASRVFRRVAEASRLLRRAVESATAHPSAATMPLSRLGADEDELTMRQGAVIASIDSLRTQMKATAQLLEEEAQGGRSTGPRGSRSSPSKPRSRHHHQPWSIAG